MKSCILFHSWRKVKGDFNIYYKCINCGKSRVKLGKGGYQPIDLL